MHLGGEEEYSQEVAGPARIEASLIHRIDTASKLALQLSLSVGV